MYDVCNSPKSAFHILPCFILCRCHRHCRLFQSAVLNKHKINELESLHVEMYHYVLGNRGIIFLAAHVLLIIISPSNVL